MVKLDRFLVAPKSPIREVMACIDRNAKGAALVVNEERRLIGTVTDGDIRRAILAGMDLELPVQDLLERRASTPYPRPITASVGTSDVELLRLMGEHSIRHIPLLDKNGGVVDIALLSDLVKEYDQPLTAVVMAGGYGTRLCPLTEELPKPMMPVGERPLLELIIEQLRQAGIRRVNLTTHYKPEIITEHFGDGRRFGVQINYVNEEQPLGTAGALGLMDAPKEPLLVINGDILTSVNFRAMLDFHREHKADMTVGVRKYEFQVPYGMIETEGVQISRLVEKPSLDFFINAGIYFLEPIVYRYLPKGRRFDMTDLIQQLLEKGRTVVSFPIVEYWLDIGQHPDYEQAQGDQKKGKLKK